LRSQQQQIWVAAYKWPIYFFVAVAFWNFVGAGLFGFLINPPIALYYMQGLNTTPVHGHTALFGVYGMLGLGLMLFCLRALRPGKAWKNAPLAFAFWMINIGLALMVLLSMLPIGLMQAWASVEYGTWYARSAEFLHSGHLNQLRWMRMIGDSIFALGALALGWFVLGLVTGHSYDKRGYVEEGAWEVLPQEVTLSGDKLRNPGSVGISWGSLCGLLTNRIGCGADSRSWNLVPAVLFASRPGAVSARSSGNAQLRQ
jgi:nitric oxide reductase subunit B